MPTIFQRKHSSKVDLNVYKKGTVSSFLIPAKLAKKLNKICPVVYTPKRGKVYQLASLLNRLLNKYRGLFALGQIPFSEKPKLLYQEEGQNLQTFKFRPDNADWFELGVLAYGMGVTRCWLFTLMLKLEFSSLSKFINLPLFQKIARIINVSRPRMIQQIFGKRRFVHRILHFRI